MRAPGRHRRANKEETGEPMPRIRQQNVLAAQWAPNGGALGAPDLTSPDNQVFGENVFSPAVQRQRLPRDVSRRLSQTLARGEALDTSTGRCGRAGDEGVGTREGRHPLHPLVPAPHRDHRREARQLLRPHWGGHGAGRVQRQGADPGRARRLLFPHRRHPRHLRGARLHGLGPDLPRLHPGEPQRRGPVHPHRVRILDRGGAGPQDPAAALDGGPLQVGHARTASCSETRPRGACSRRSAPSRSTS